MIKLHTQIFLGLIFGAIVGAFFAGEKKTLRVTFQHGAAERTVRVQDWDSLKLITPHGGAVFDSNDQSKVIRFFSAVPFSDRPFSLLKVYGASIERDPEDEFTIHHLRDIARPVPWPVYLKPLGVFFIRLLNFISIPLVLASLLVGAASLGDVRKLVRTGGKALSYFLVTTAFAITIGLALASVIRPGEHMSPDTKEELMGEFQQDIQKRIQQNISLDIVSMFVNLVPTNPFSALANGEMLQIVFFAVFTGVVLTYIPEEKSEPVIQFFRGLSDTMIRMVELVMLIAPFAVFALVATIVCEFGFNILKTLFWYVLTVVGGLVLHVVIVYSGFLKIFSTMSVRRFFQGMRSAQFVAFTTSSSAATLPVTMECCEKNLGVPKHVTSFVLPLGATINMDGTALYQGVAASFIAQVYGFDLTLAQQLTIVLTATLASIGTAPVPGVGIVMLVIVLKAIQVPEEGIALILGVDRFLDMCRTVPNITGDAVGSVIIAESESNRKRNGGELPRIETEEVPTFT